jgi:hypothetical protein
MRYSAELSTRVRVTSHKERTVQAGPTFLAYYYNAGDYPTVEDLES